MNIYIQMMKEFVIFAGRDKAERLSLKSPKGIALLQMLILKRGDTISSSELMNTLWNDDNTSNPESALKTLVSRLRTILNQVAPDLGKCLITDRGGYHWQEQENIYVDVLDIMRLLDVIEDEATDDETRDADCKKLVDLFLGDLCHDNEFNDWALPMATTLHGRYMTATKEYISRLKANNDFEQVIYVCRKALEVDNFDDEMHIELMNALMEINRPNDAMQQYRHTFHLYSHYLGIQPSAAIQEFYKKIVSVGRKLDFNLESIQRELRESCEEKGAFICEYAVFKDVFNMQVRNLERVNIPMFLGLISVTCIDDRQNEDIMYNATIMDDLMEILKNNLRKGDMVTRFSANIVAMILPTVNYMTGHMIMERLKNAFYKKYPSSGIIFDYRLGPLTSGADMMIPDSNR